MTAMLLLTAFGAQFCAAPATCDLGVLIEKGEAAGYRWVLTSVDEPPDFSETVLFPEYRNTVCEKVGIAEDTRVVWFCRNPPIAS